MAVSVTTPLNELIIQYRKAQRALIDAQDADQATFDDALAACRAIRRQMIAMIPESETYDCREGNIVKQV